MKRAAEARLTEGGIGKIIIRMAVPMAVALLGRVTFNLVDAFFVGRLGTEELAAISFTFPVVLVVTSISLGLGVGASATISRAIGERNHHRIKRLTTDALILSFLIVLGIAITGLLTIDPLFSLLGVPPSLMHLVRQYMTIWYCGVPVVIIPMVGNNAIRATGDTKTPGIVMLISVAVNIGLDPLLIFGIGPFPRMEVAGAALATVISRSISLIISLWILIHREKMIAFVIPKIKDVVKSWKQILYIGLPAALANLVNPVAMGVVTRLAAGYGTAAVAGYGVATRIESIVMMVVGAFASVLIPFTGQNWGAGKIERVKRGIRLSQLYSMLWCVSMFIVLFITAKPIAGIFNKNPEVISTASLYLRIVGISYAFFGLLRLSVSALNALNKPLQSAVLSILRLFTMYIPLAYLGSLLFALKGIFGGAALANVLAGVIAFFWLKRALP
jgi:putative MATE family efflux protein